MSLVDEDIVWDDDDPEFAAALSVYMDGLEAEAKKQPSQPVESLTKAVVVVDEDSGDGLWTEDDPDFALALSMYLDQVEAESSGKSLDHSPHAQADHISMFECVIDRKLEDLDPNPDIWNLFRMFDDRFFNGDLKKKGVMLGWSPRMTSCAGLCAWRPRSSFCEIKLSQPLLMLRPRSDLVETLIHEMIHALLFVNRQDDNHESHGQLFHMHMYRINKSAGCNITVFHSFHDEVRHYQKHVWMCDGPCRKRPPYFGIVRRAMNRAPGPSDYWFGKHRSTCGGTFVKVEGPAPASRSSAKTESKANVNQSPRKRPPKGTADIRNYFPLSPEKASSSPTSSCSNRSAIGRGSSSPQPQLNNTVTPLPSTSGAHIIQDSVVPESFKLPVSFKPFSGIGHVLGKSSSRTPASSSSYTLSNDKVELNRNPAVPSTTITVVGSDENIEVIDLD